MPARSTSPISAPAGLRGHGRRRRGRTGAHGRHAAAIDDRPLAFRYPRGDGVGIAAGWGTPLEIGKGRIVREGTKVALLSLRRAPRRMPRGRRRARRLWPAPPWPMRASPSRSTPTCPPPRARARVLIVVEEGAIGGFGSHVLQLLCQHDALSGGLKVRSLVLPDLFLDHDTPAAMYARAGLDADGIVQAAFDCLGRRAGLRSAELV
jgi:1-deoxy-D-xylulose-5-phosphate synthase